MIPPMPASDLAVFILAGGKSTRMGRDKAFVLFDGRTLLSRALDLAHLVAEEVCIVGERQKYSSVATTVEDIFPDCGPLGGIHAALRASQKDLSLVLAVDVPFVSQRLLEYLVERARSRTPTVTVPRAAKGFQPLCAVYRRAFAEIAEEALRTRRYKIDSLFDPAYTQIITEDELRSAGCSAEEFRNLNTPTDLENTRE